ncbi:SusD/RagB family nutrient-binding outer membrane lipoprotein [Poritiphilus flavus]|uniref:SusD/RagB family nutrient-binding outer membrane lipoprotein n=1 Tax=Poritiphilus flavus TaxID=2697053 RepID=A0A6L9EHM7_9FLAO|nr:SusD/RagB family nutrient-binding outer membrane lipoprotein [Poritiphilus flavus]NAS14195.1 SusD/RagB family nutrient-binding outer membrane lipoprotein [Poritiphilus flavus]
MRKIFKYFTVVLIAGSFVTSCETTDLDLRVSPNDLAADQADPNLLLNSIQLAYAVNMDDISDNGAELTRIDYFFGRIYFNELPGDTFDDIWARTYSSEDLIEGDGLLQEVGIFTNVNNLIEIDQTSDIDYSFHIGVARVLQAHMLFLLADYLGTATWSQAANPVEFPTPMLDTGEQIYTAAFGLLDEAESLLASGPATQGATDLFYDGDTDQWIKLINTIRLRSYFNTGDTAAFNSIISGGNFISDSEDDFEFQYGTSELQPDNRHPDYIDDYTPSGANIYQSNWLMETMLELADPRIRYYFYRQVDATPGATGVPPNEEDLACSLVVPPPHYDGFTYCSVANGYWGRSHGNDEGTPPDNFKRTAVGVYPAAGLFDDSSFGEVGLGLGGGGAGIEPILLASYVDFMRGAMAASATEKAAFLRAGMEKSIAKVQGFGALDGSADKSFEPSEADVTAYIDGVIADFNAATGDDQENIFAEQYWIALYGGGTESYNYYRKTGFPTTVSPSWEPDPGPFPRTFLLPQNEVLTNPNLSQRTDLNTQVFWDTNPASPTFPPAN